MTASPGFYQDESYGDIRLAATFRRGFRQAMVIMNRALASNDLSPLQYHLLLEAGAAGEEGLVQGELAELLQTPEARVSLLVHEMVERGLLTTTRGAPDRRTVMVGITSQGCGVVHEALLAQRSALAEMAREFDLPIAADMLRRALNLYLGFDLSDGTVSIEDQAATNQSR